MAETPEKPVLQKFAICHNDYVLLDTSIHPQTCYLCNHNFSTCRICQFFSISTSSVPLNLSPNLSHIPSTSLNSPPLPNFLESRRRQKDLEDTTKLLREKIKQLKLEIWRKKWCKKSPKKWERKWQSQMWERKEQEERWSLMYEEYREEEWKERVLSCDIEREEMDGEVNERDREMDGRDREMDGRDIQGAEDEKEKRLNEFEDHKGVEDFVEVNRED